MRQFLLSAVAALTLAASAHAGGPAMRVGAAEDIVKQTDLVSAKAKMTLLRLAGFDTVRVTMIWSPGELRPPTAEAQKLRNAVTAARLSGVRVVVSVYHYGSATTPLTPEARTEFATYTAWLARAFPYLREFIIGNEPNLNRFWLPQFDEAGASVSAPAYLELLAETYDALKAVSLKNVVWGGALAPRGIDRPGTRPTHSPSRFIRDLGAAYRVTERPLPVMDGLAIHPYGDSSSQAPSRSRHSTSTIGLADYDKLVRLLGIAFDGTAQPGSTLPILYDEYGVESVIPTAKAPHYTGAELPATRPVDERTQGAYYREAIGLAFCQPNVRGMLLFHVADEPAKAAWQSGVFYADGTPKRSLPAVAAATAESRRGVVSRCRGLELTPKLLKLRFPSPLVAQSHKRTELQLRCDIDCLYTVTIEPTKPVQPAAPFTGAAVGAPKPKAPKPAATGTAVGKIPTRVRLALPKTIVPGAYRYVVTLTAPLNPGPPVLVRSRPFTLTAQQQAAP